MVYWVGELVASAHFPVRKIKLPKSELYARVFSRISLGDRVMKKHPKGFITPKDTPATRKRRLQQRLQELSDKSEQEIAAIMKSVEKVKSALRPKQ